MHFQRYHIQGTKAAKQFIKKIASQIYFPEKLYVKNEIQLNLGICDFLFNLSWKIYFY